MAERRMLAKSIIESDAFSDMPVEAQMLYVRLNLAADDDGFVSNPRSIMRSCGASNDSMLLLINKKFILSFEKGDNFVYLIKHWRIHNFIRKDRHTASTFRELLRGVYYDENKAYSTSPGDGKTPVLAEGDFEAGQPSVNQLSTAGQPSDNQTDNQVTTKRQLGGVQAVDPGKDRLVKDRVSIETGEERIEEGECEGKQPPAAASLSDPEKRRERIIHWKKRIKFMKDAGFDSDCMYTLAAGEGITKEEIDNFKEDLS